MTDIAVLRLSTRPLTALRNGGCSSVEQLSVLVQEPLWYYRVRNIGAVSAQEVERKLTEYKKCPASRAG